MSDNSDPRTGRAVRDLDLCRELDWDSSFFGFKIGSVTAGDLNEAQMLELLAWAAMRQIDCLYFLADSNVATIRLAEGHRFQLVDLRVTLARELGGRIPNHEPPEGILVRPAVTNDIPLLSEIAAHSHTDSRFYQDGNFPRSRCDDMYRTWIEQSVSRFCDTVLVAELEGRPAGYISCQLEGGSGRIGLVGVDAKSRNIGLGRILLTRALGWFSEKGVNSVIVVTQGRNVAAQRLYQRHGFLTRSIQLWYHLWLAKRNPEPALLE